MDIVLSCMQMCHIRNFAKNSTKIQSIAYVYVVVVCFYEVLRYLSSLAIMPQQQWTGSAYLALVPRPNPFIDPNHTT